MRGGVLDDRSEPEHDAERGQAEEADPRQPSGELAARQHRAHEDVRDERDADEQHVGRVDERQRQGGRRDGEPGRPAGTLREPEERRDRRRREQLAGGARRQREHGIRAAAPLRETAECDLREHGCQPRPGPAEHGDAGLVRDDEGDGHEHRRLVEQHGARVRAGEPRDERDEHVPERKRVARVEARRP